MVLDLLSNITAIIALLGIIVGALISPRISHKIGHEYSRGEVIFRKKLEYFEKVLETIEKNKRMYSFAIKKIESTKKQSEIKAVIKQLKEERAHFLVMSSPLYLDVRKISEKIIHFVKLEGIIFNRIAGLTTKNKKDIDLIIEQLKEDLKMLNIKGEEILFEMRKELRR